MAKSAFSLARYKDAATVELLNQTDQRTLAVWAIDCAERVMPFFERAYPLDERPRQAIATLQSWLQTGVFEMAIIRHASLNAHAAARDVGEENSARSAARAAGQAVATAHVPLHALGAANYALQAIHRSSTLSEAEDAVAREREWQFQRLRELCGGG